MNYIFFIYYFHYHQRGYAEQNVWGAIVLGGNKIGGKLSGEIT